MNNSDCVMLMQAAGAHIYQTDPSANYFECRAMAIGARSQSARTYLERRLDEVLACATIEELVLHALRALRDTLPNELTLSDKVTLAFTSCTVDTRTRVLVILCHNALVGLVL